MTDADLESAIAEIARERVAAMRASPAPTKQQQIDEMCAAAEQGWWAESLRENRDMIATVALMPVVVLCVAWIAEQTMRSM